MYLDYIHCTWVVEEYLQVAESRCREITGEMLATDAPWSGVRDAKEDGGRDEDYLILQSSYTFWLQIQLLASR